MRYQVITEMPSDTDLLATDAERDYLIGNDVIATLSGKDTQFANVSCPDGGTMMLHTRVQAGRKIVHAHLDMDSEDLSAELDALIALYNLDWEVVSMSSYHKHLPYDANDDPILSDVDDGEGGTVQAHVPVQIVITEIPEADMLGWMADVVTDDTDPDNPVYGRPTEIRLHRYAGAEPVAVAA